MIEIFFGILIISSFGSHNFVQCLYEDQPKILNENGTLVIESAFNRNISLKYSGRSAIKVGATNLVDVVEDAKEKHEIFSLDTDPANFQIFVDNLKSQVIGPSGIESRISAVENVTRDDTFRRGRLSRLLRRIENLERRILVLQNKLVEDNCRDAPCKNGGVCFDLYDDYLCDCSEGWQGPTCEVDVNECAFFAGTDLGCQNNALCINTFGSYRCNCTAGWVGVHCTKRETDCLSSPSAEMCGHGVCIPVRNDTGYTCLCEQGWTKDNSSAACIVDVNECDGPNPCTSECINLPGSYTCGPCAPGYTGNGVICSDINECLLFNGGCSVQPLVTCYNTEGSYRCGQCPPGYMGDGKTCTRVDTNTCTTNNICHPQATCQQLPNSISCLCPQGMIGDGIGPNGCRPNPNPCADNLCLNGGTCVADGQSYTCMCPPGYLPPMCLASPSPCDPNPCNNGGTCNIEDTYKFRCSCPPNFFGRFCSYDRRSCTSLIAEPSGWIKYPNNNDTYNHNERCVWVLRTNRAKVLNVTFETFNLEYSRNCVHDWLQIHDGRTSSAQLIGRFCGTDKPKGGNIISSHNELYLWFRSDNSSSRDGFSLFWNSIDPVCGGIFDAKSHGVISSPGYPGKSPPDRRCEWSITGEIGKRIHLIFYSVEANGSPSNCSDEYIAIYEGSTTTGSVLGKYCEQSNPDPLVTPANEVLVVMQTDNVGSDTLFQIHYSSVPGIPGCGGVFTYYRGELRSPLVQGTYPNNLLCEYLIQLPTDSTVQLEFDKFDLEETYGCVDDYVEIYEGKTDQDSIGGRWCGRNYPRNYASKSNVLLIKFRTDSLIRAEGFVIKYKIGCEPSYLNNTGHVKSPNYPKPYFSNFECVYKIEAPLGHVINMTSLDFQLEGSYPSCPYDYIDVFDGQRSEEKRVGRFCGTKAPPTILSSHNLMEIVFRSDLTNQLRGFYLSYNFVDIGCGGVLKDINGTISSPRSNDVNQFGQNVTCIWILDLPSKYTIHLKFTAFNIIDTTECATNYLEILYKSPRGVVTQRHCGSEIPPVSFYNEKIKIVYKSQVGLTGDGFEATYEGADSKLSCGGNVSAPYGVLQSPNYPEDYPDSKHCTWIITVPLGHQVELTVHAFHLEDDCRFDYLEIRDGRTTSSPLIGKYCDVKIPPSISSYTNIMRLDFHSDSSREYPGFEIVWQETSTGCGGTLTSYEGSIVSPHYPERVNALMQCDWKILVNHGSKLAIDVKYLDIDSSSTNCADRDYVRVYDGEDLRGRKFPTNCSAGAREDTFVTSGNHAFVRFVSDVNYTGVFHLNYTSKCRQELRSHFGIIESPNFPNDYPLNLNCEWRIIGKRGSTISISFSHFDLETALSGECLHDKLSIIEVNRNNETIKSTDYCAERPSSFESVEETVIVKFTTDFSISKTGFRLEYKIDGCDEIFTYSTHRFYSPDYPSGAVNKDCEYFINVEYGNVITLTFQSFSFPKKRDCSSGSILIADGYNTSNILAEICQSESLAMRYTSSSNKMYMRFRADAVNNGKKFSASYQTTPALCGGFFTGSEGYIYSPNYPKPYDANTSCKWYVQVEEHHSIDLSFIDLQLSENSTCNDKVEILDDSKNTIYEYCSGSPRPTDIIRVASHRALVVFSSEQATTGKGFKLYYKQNCGYSGTIRDGIITKRPDMNNCIWSLKADEEQKIKLYFTHVQCSCSERTNNSKCTGHEGIFVYDGDSTNAPLKVSFCKRQPPEIISTGSFITVEATKGSFLLFYDTYTSTCGGRVTSLHGALATPEYPMSYPSNIECIWEVYTTPGNSIQMFFKDFEVVSNSQSCNEDYLEVRKSNEDGELLGIYCGDNRPSSFLAYEQIWVKFRSDGNFVGKGFYAEYSYAHHNEISGNFGQIKSPPLDYMHDEVEDYTYRIYVNDTNVVRLRFKQYTRGLKVYEGYDDTALEVEIDTDTNRFVSRTSYVFLKAIHSEIETFQITWMAIPKNTTDEKALTKCGHNIISVGTAVMNFTSPNYPDNYENNLNCEWIIKPSDPSRRAAIHLHDVSVEIINDCYADYITISESSDMENWSNERKICQIDNIESFYGTPYLKINFVTDSSIKGKGFRAVLGANCGSNMTDSSGVIVYDEYTSDEKNCTWTIRVNRGHLIKFKLIEKNMNLSQTCENYLSIRDGFDSSSPFLGIGKYCVNHTDEIPPTSTNRAYIRFVQTAWRNNMYWVLQYEEIREGCGETIHLTRFIPEATITTPNFPNIPKPYSECIWIVMAPYGEAVNITFVDMHLRRSSECGEEKLTILDGATELAPEKQTVCGTARPNNFKSSQNAVYLKYTSDIPIPSNGFKLIASIAKCGYKFSYSRGIITSKNYPMLGAYPRRSVCEYLIEAKYGSINITFNDIDLPMATNVSSQADHLIFYYVEVEEDSNNTKLEEALRIYGNTTTKSMLFMSKNLLIKFFTFDLNTSHRGFKLGYDIIPSLCSKEYVADAAEITTPMYPQRPRSDVTCTWRISVPHGRRIKVQLVDFRIDLRRPNQLEEKSLFRFFNDYGLTSKISETSENSGVPIYSSTSTMVIQFVYNSKSNFISAKLRFTSNEPSICSADLTQRSGQIVPPAGNLPAYLCDYSFPVETNETVALTIRDVVVTGNLSRCRMNPPIRIATRPLNNRNICTNVSKTTFSVNSERNYLRIIKTNLTETLSYTINFKKHMCGGEIYDFGQGTSFGKPFFSENYGQVDCMWSFRGRRPRVLVNLTITINSPVDCDKEYIRLYGPRGRVVGTYCGNSVTEDITLPYGDVEYHVDSYSPNSNFNINLKLSLGCGGIISDRVRDIRLRKTDYTNNAECIWYILTEDSRYFLIELSFIGRFFIEDSPNCTKDYLEIRNSNNEGTDLISKVCGRQNPAPVYTRGREIKLIFRSDNDTLGEGFTIGIERLCISNFVATDTWQNVSKPVLANSRKVNCTFEITAPSDTWIQVQFNQIDLRKDENCTKENISAIVKGNRREETIPDFCDLNTRNEIWSKGKVIISYKSSLFRSFSTFEFGFRSLGCGGVINSTTVIESPKAANMRYPSNMRCRWNITAPVGKVIIIEFKEFEYESSTGCQYDFVTIFSGSDINRRKPVAHLCGSLTGQTSPYTIDDNNAIIVTESDASVNDAGFTARIKILDRCKYEVPLTFPYAPYVLNRFARPYGNDMDCQVIFTTHPNNSIQIRFDQFDLKPCNSTTSQTANECSCDFVEIREGTSETGHLIGRYCGNTIPSPITSLGDMLFLRFSTDSSGVGAGFLATVTSNPSVCGQRLLQVNPNHETIVQIPESGTYLPNVRCLWYIHSEQPFDIHFERFDLQEPKDDGSCADYLEISLNKRIENSDIIFQDYYYSRPSYLGRVESEKGTFRYCGNSTPSNYLSDIKRISLKFISDSIIQKTGFKLVAKTITTCFKNLTGLSGRVVIHDTMECVVHVDAPENYTITLHLFSPHGNVRRECISNFTMIYDKKTNNLLTAICSIPEFTKHVFLNASSIRMEFKNLTRTPLEILYFANSPDQGIGCGGDIYTYNGVISSPLYPENIRNYTSCQWNVRGPENSIMRLSFLEFDMGSRALCANDNIQIIETPGRGYENSTRLFCGEDRPDNIDLRSSSFAVVYKKTVNFDGTGWILAFQSQANSN